MKVKYDPEVDILRIILNDAPVQESDESRPGVIVDFDTRRFEACGRPDLG
jgi:uncharacterized protein YuzE